MLTKLEARNPLGSVLTLELDDVSDGLILEDIQGIDPVKATLVASTFANLPGGYYQSSRREPRNIVVVLGLEPDYISTSVQDLRDRLYDYFMPQTVVNLRFYTDEGLTVEIEGHVETFEAPLFTNEPKATISVMCFDPDLAELTATTVSHNTVSDSTNFTIAYDGSIETGIVLQLNVNRSLTQFTIVHQAPDGTTQSFDVQASLVNGDVVTINTIRGSKGATLLRSSTLSSILYGVSPQSVWITLQKGDNLFRVHATGAAIPYTVQYTPRYGGL